MTNEEIIAVLGNNNLIPSLKNIWNVQEDFTSIGVQEVYLQAWESLIEHIQEKHFPTCTAEQIEEAFIEYYDDLD